MQIRSFSSSFWRRPSVLVVGGVLLAGLALILWQRLSPMGGGADTMPGQRPVPVRVTQVLQQDMPRYLTALGTVQPSGSVLVRSRVDGQLMRLHFEEGQAVKMGDLLAEIDPRPFQNTLNEAQGQLAKNKALLENARRDLVRYAQLSKGDFIAEQQVETQRALVRQYEGVVGSDEATVASATLQLEYSRVTAPMAGRLGLRQVDEGNMIKAADTTGLVRITRTKPCDVLFTLPEADLPALLVGHRAADVEGRILPVMAWDRTQKTLLGTGRLFSMDNQIDAATGTVKLKARFSNTDEALFPNQFVNVRLEVQVRKNATVIPAAAVQLGSQGSYVYVIQDGKAVLTRITPGWRTDAEMVVDAGLTPGQTVVVDGLDRLRDGMGVTLPQQPPQPQREGTDLHR